MSTIEKGLAWANNRQRVRADVRKRLAAVVEKHGSTSTNVETLEVLLESTAGRLVFEVASQDAIALYLERLSRDLRRGKRLEF